jgi:hypothetical protein
MPTYWELREVTDETCRRYLKGDLEISDFFRRIKELSKIKTRETTSNCPGLAYQEEMPFQARKDAEL